MVALGYMLDLDWPGSVAMCRQINIKAAVFIQHRIPCLVT